MNQKSLTFKTETILDCNLYNSPVKALEVSLPAQWGASGGVYRCKVVLILVLPWVRQSGS